MKVKTPQKLNFSIKELCYSSNGKLFDFPFLIYIRTLSL